MPTPRNRSGREKFVNTALELLNTHGPEALQARKVATAVGTSTMGVYTYFGGMPGLIAEVAQEGWRRFDAALTLPPTDDPVADLFAMSAAYRRFAVGHPHLYRLMFGSTSAHGINAPSYNMLTMSPEKILKHYPSFAHPMTGAHRAIAAGRFEGSADDPLTVISVAAQMWTLIHGFVMLELAGFFGDDGSAVDLVLAVMTTRLAISLGDPPDRVEQSRQAALQLT
ncbi:TetR family transcriptional regulator [Mycolicibacter senuensis]|uniref:TetR family transcriptional regulator n=1 Tax=Mycolicibacter senuensis TaxID=386913 RepID=A0A7I9XR58_9MYCO|nr:WHG domain-containing protein [Actinomycetota bacterium]GFG72248.1 TetR family transcriptional regulator [Mycolicibacter senuensis]